MTRTVGRVDFTARINGKGTARDAERIGQNAGKSTSEGFDETWSKGFRESFDKNARQAFDRWKKNGKKSGTVYGGTFTRAFTSYIKKAQSTFDQFTLNPRFLDDLKAKFNDAGLAAGEVQRHLIDLNREGIISQQVFDGARRKVDEWAIAQRGAAESTKLQAASMDRLNDFLTQQRKEYEDGQFAIEKNRQALVDRDKAIRLDREKAFAQHLRDTRQRLLENVEVHIRSSQALRNHVARVGDAGLAYRSFQAYLEQYRSAAGGTDKTFIDISKSIDKMTGSMDKNSDSTKKMTGGWSAIPHNGRQVILIAAAIAGGMEQIAVLGSAAGAGLLVLGGAATGALVGLGGVVAAFQMLGGDAERVPESIKKAAEAFRDLRTPLLEAQEFLSERAWAGTEVAFERIGGAIRDLTPALAPLGDVINRVTNKFSEWIASSDGIRLMTGLLENSAGIFEKVLDIIGDLGEALLEAFDNPKFQKAIDDMLDGLGSIIDTFGEFVKSDDFGTWIEETASVLGKFGDLIGGTATLIQNLVTPEAYERTRDFLTNLTESLPGLGEFLDIFSELDIFGVIAVGLNELLNGLKPLWDLLAPIASIVGDLLVGSFQNLHFWILLLTPAFEGMRIIFEILAGALSKWLEYVTPFQQGFQLLSDALAVGADIIWEQLKPAFDDLWDVIIDLLPTAEEFTTWINDYAVPAIQTFAAWLGTEGADAIRDFANWLKNHAVPAMSAFWDWLSKKVWPVIERAPQVVAIGIAAFRAFADGISNAVSFLTGPIRYAIDLFNQLASAASVAFGNASAAKNAGANIPKMASGGVLGGPRYVLAGEAGPEAIVPLRRNLDRVDPSVRWLSAIAQGKSPAMAGGGVTGGRSVVNTFEAGSIVVQGSDDPRATALEVVDEIADRVGS